MATLTSDGVEIYFEVHGSGPAILLSHGFSATSQMWTGQIEALAANHTLILWDMRGHGRSAAPDDDAAYSEKQTTADMAALLDHVGVATAVVGGLSLGGYMSLAFYADFAERVDALLIIDTGPGYKRDEARAGWNKQALATAQAIATQGAAALNAGSAERSQSHHNDLNGLVHAARGMLTQQTSRVIELLPEIGVPSLVLAGADDEPFLAATDYMAAKIPASSKVLVPDAGHAVNIDQPQAFNRAVVEFLDLHSL